MVTIWGPFLKRPVNLLRPKKLFYDLNVYIRNYSFVAFDTCNSMSPRTFTWFVHKVVQKHFLVN